MDNKYYFFIKYFKRKDQFFASEIYDALIEDECFFTKARIIVAINYFIGEGKISVSPIKYHLNSTTSIKKYKWIGK